LSLGRPFKAGTSNEKDRASRSDDCIRISNETPCFLNNAKYSFSNIFWLEVLEVSPRYATIF